MIFPLLLSAVFAADTGPAANGVRPISGFGINPRNKNLGSYGGVYSRASSYADYEDGLSAPSGSKRGQFVAHDVALTDVDPNDNMPYPINSCDFVDPGVPCNGYTTLNFNRARVTTAYGRERRVINFATAYLDASVLYGSNDETHVMLRTWSKGLMRSYINPVSGAELLPIADNSTTQAWMAAGPSSTVLFLAGDKRANVHPMLQTLHTLLLREHNRKAREIYSKNSTLTDSMIFERARSWVIALFQKITVYEYLPNLLGTGLAEYKGYDSEIDPSIDTDFIGAAYRYGHSAVSGMILRVDDDGDEIPSGHLQVHRHFFQTRAILENTDGDIESILRGLVIKRDREADTLMVDDMRKHFVAAPFDMAATNIMRGRDFGIPGYNQVRDAVGLVPVTSFDDITSDKRVAKLLQALYGSVNNIDTWVGGLAEDKEGGSNLGPLFSTIIRNQFQRLRDGDRFWFERAGVLHPDDAQEIQTWSLSKMVLKNTNITNFPSNPFAANTYAFAPSKGGANNKVQALPDLLIKWNKISDSAITFTLCGDFDGWVGIGFNPKSVTMINTDFIIAIPSTNGWSVGNYFSGSSPVPASVMTVVTNAADAAQTCGTRIGVSFTRQIDPKVANMYSIASPVYLVYAHGTSFPTAHTPTNRGGLLVDFNASVQVETRTDGLEKKLGVLIFHGIVMFTLYGVAFPMAVFALRYFAESKNAMLFHKTFMSKGILFAELTVLLLTVQMGVNITQTHAKMGLALFIMMLTVAQLGQAAFSNSLKRFIPLNIVRNTHRILAATTLLYGYPVMYFGIEDLAAYGDPILEKALIYSFFAWIVLLILAFVVLGEFKLIKKFVASPSKQKKSMRILRTFGLAEKVENKEALHFSWAEIVKRVLEGKKWLVIDGVVYDVARFMDEHPGGRTVLAKSLGTDCTSGFYGKTAPLFFTSEDAAEKEQLQSRSSQVSATGRSSLSQRPSILKRRSTISSTSSGDNARLEALTNNGSTGELITSAAGFLKGYAHAGLAISRLAEFEIGVVENYQKQEHRGNSMAGSTEDLSKPVKKLNEYEVAREKVRKYLNDPRDKEEKLAILPTHFRKLRLLSKKLVVSPNCSSHIYKFKFAFDSGDMFCQTLPGDYIMLMDMIETKDGQLNLVQRPYTPIHVSNHGTLDLIIKIYARRNSFTSVLDSLEAGGTIRACGPLTDKIALNPQTPHGCYQNILMLAAGTGITPMLLLIDYYTKIMKTRGDEPDGPKSMTLVTFDTTVEDIILRKELLSLQHAQEGGVKIHRYVSKLTAPSDLCSAGRVCPVLLKPFIPEGQDLQIFASGPPGFQDSVQKAVLYDFKRKESSLVIF